MLISAFEAENKKNKPRTDNKKRLKKMYGSK
jgi:hypothetical protein